MGKLIVIEGLDGSGKSTQYELLAARLEAEGYDFRKVSFPDYESDSSALVKMYLSGEFGEKDTSLNAYQGSVLFAVDRLCTMKLLENEIQDGFIVLDRYFFLSLSISSIL